MATLGGSVIYADVEKGKEILRSLDQQKEELNCQIEKMKMLAEMAATGWAGVSGEAVLRQIENMRHEHQQILYNLENKIEMMKKCLASIESKDRELGHVFSSINERGFK